MPYFEFLGCRGPFCETRFLLLWTPHFEKIQVVGGARMHFAAWMAPNGQTSDEQGGAMRYRAWLPLLGTQWPL